MIAMIWASTFIGRPVVIGALSSVAIHVCVGASILFLSALSAGNGVARGSPEPQLLAFPVFYAELANSPQQANAPLADTAQTELAASAESTLAETESPVEPVAEVALPTKEAREIRRVNWQREIKSARKNSPKATSHTAQPSEFLPSKAQADSGGDEFTRASLGFGSLDGTGSGSDIDQILRARPLNDPKPPFPPMARRLGFEGSVVLKVAIGPNGKVLDATVKRSSGRTDCDQSALRTLVDQWTFQPAQVRGRAVDSSEEIVVVYSLSDA